ncbi:MAG: carbonic anhydrase [Magnetococcales bacterium]|nr:carbonic anhydrase [Magnetococcales bacterium]NGZ27856.1 carbonic anhydrase [Magnetococcales bacterium]
MCNNHSPILSRRQILQGVALGAVSLALPRWSMASAPAAPTMSPDEALALLKEGNTRFVSRSLQHPNSSLERQMETATKGQHPFATILSCSDSRVPVEMLFDRGIGDLFIIRVGGNVAHTDEIASAEYGSEHLGVPLIVILGHTHCGAVTAVAKGDSVGGSIPQLVSSVQPVVDQLKAKGLTGEELVNESIKGNVRQGLLDMRAHSADLAQMEKEGKIKLVGGVYVLETGQVEWL